MSLLIKACLAALAGLLVSIQTGCSANAGDGPEVLVFAAASLVDALTEIEREFEAQSDTRVAFSFGGSQTLARQIASGAPADLFIAAGEFPVEFLAEKYLVEPEPVDLLANRLVAVTRTDEARIDSIYQLAQDVVGRIAIADPELAPAGRYAKESLSRLGLWEALQGKLVTGIDVRATLAYVEAGNVDVALVYRTDAMIAGDVRVLDIVPPGSHSPIIYPAAVLQRSERKASARGFLQFLQSPAARSIFLKRGFQPLDS